MKFHSEHGEDKWIYKNIRLPEKGFYVDIGAAHPTQMSNTAFLREKGWKGIQIDADPYWIPYWEKIGLELINRTVWSEDVMVPFAVNKKARRLSKIEKSFKPDFNNPGFCSLSIILNDLFKKRKIEHINFMSLDIEGFEFDVFSSLPKKYYPDVLIFKYNTLGGKDFRLSETLFSDPCFKYMTKTANNFIFCHTNRTYDYHRSCWRYKHGHVFTHENHPCYFCGHKLPMKYVDKTECKVCGIMICPKCGNCLCTITDLQYSTLIRIHEKYCCHLDEYKGKIELEEPYDHMLVKNYLRTIQTCFNAERKEGNV